MKISLQAHPFKRPHPTHAIPQTREDSISTSMVKVADMEIAARYAYDYLCFFSFTGIIVAMVELEFLYGNDNEA